MSGCHTPIPDVRSIIPRFLMSVRVSIPLRGVMVKKMFFHIPDNRRVLIPLYMITAEICSPKFLMFVRFIFPPPTG